MKSIPQSVSRRRFLAVGSVLAVSLPAAVRAAEQTAVGSVMGTARIIAFAVDDLDASVRFYMEVMGLTLHRRIPTGHPGLDFVFLRSGDLLIELMSRKIPFFKDYPLGFHHLSFEAGDLDAAMSALAEREVNIVTQPKPKPNKNGLRMGEFEGPEGLVLKVYSWEESLP